MTEEEAKLYAILNGSNLDYSHLPDLQTEDNKGMLDIANKYNMPNIATFFGLNGNLLNGEYNIKPNFNINSGLNYRAQYSHPMLGGNFTINTELTPSNQSLYLKYGKSF